MRKTKHENSGSKSQTVKGQKGYYGQPAATSLSSLFSPLSSLFSSPLSALLSPLSSFLSPLSFLLSPLSSIARSSYNLNPKPYPLCACVLI